ncbi:MAG: hypothetical protein QXP42_05620 [Candidatus Micrarchaeia archaeon]
MRGQMFSYDIVFAVLLVTVLLVASLHAYQMKISGFYERTEKERIFALANSAISHIVVSSHGCGIAKTRNVLDENKTAELFSKIKNDYNETKKLLGIVGYEFNMSIEMIDGRTIYSAGKVGVGSVVVSTERYGLLNGSVVRVRLVVWK